MNSELKNERMKEWKNEKSYGVKKLKISIRD